MNAPLPTTAVASKAVTQVKPMTLPPAKFVGIALNNTGQIYLNTSTDKIYRLENNLTLTLMSSLSLAMGDLTSCNFPLAMLPGSYNNFSAALKNDHVVLNWEKGDDNIIKTYSIEHSINTIDWKELGTVNENKYGPKTISYTHNNPAKGKNYYRLRIQSSDNKIIFSTVKTVLFTWNASYAVWPNPVRNTVYIQNSDKNNNHPTIIISDQTGKKLKGTPLVQGINNIDISALKMGTYFISVHSASGEDYSYKILKN
jgi:hypothetical protein